MALNLDIVGRTSEPVAFEYNSDTAILYALGIGAGIEELEFVYEKNLKVYPTFAVLPFMPTFLNSFVAEAGLNLLTVLHGEHAITLHKPIPSAGIFYTSTTCDAIYDKGDKGATVLIRFDTKNEDGELFFENRVLIVDRGAGNFGGDRGPKTDQINPPEGKDPNFKTGFHTTLNQAAIYRLSGDKNPLHIDPDFAGKGGFDRPILHGLCSFGFACRSVLKGLCDNDPERLKSFSVRFLNVAYPGDTLITRGWQMDSKTYVIQTVNQDGKIILGNASVTLS